MRNGMMTNARQTMVNRYTRINQENCDEKGKEAYRICRGGRDEEKIGGSTITKHNVKEYRKFYTYTKNLNKEY
jgi:hypothetical protein